MQNHKTREDWLLAAIELLEPLFAAKGYTLPVCQVSCGFTSTGVRSGHIEMRLPGAHAQAVFGIRPAHLPQRQD